MSVLITLKVNGDTDRFRQSLTELKDQLEASADQARAAGAIHHRFGVGDGYVLVVDEWETAQQFEEFFSDPELQQLIVDMGGDTSAPPEITVTEAISTPDEF